MVEAVSGEQRRATFAEVVEYIETCNDQALMWLWGDMVGELARRDRADDPVEPGRDTWDPWRELRRQRHRVSVVWAWLPPRVGRGVVGFDDRSGRWEITLCYSADEDECARALTHELIHVERGMPVGNQERRDAEEARVRELTAERMAHYRKGRRWPAREHLTA